MCGENCHDNCITFVTRFLSTIIALCIGVFGFGYFVSVLMYIGEVGRFNRLEVAHFIGLGFTGLGVIGYFTIIFASKRVHKLMYVTIAVMLLGFVFTAHSAGIAAPTVDDCDEKDFKVPLLTVEEKLGIKKRGTYGQEVENCHIHTSIFVFSFLMSICLAVALFDVQRYLLQRVRSKTYGERFEELGIR